MPWIGMAGASDHAIYDALLTITERLGRLLDVGASVRQVGEMAGLGRETVSRSLKRLEARGLIRQTFAGEGRHPARWNLMPNLRSMSDNQPHTTSRSTSDNQPHTVADVMGPECPGGFAADLWRWSLGLGKSKFQVWRLLGPEPTKATNLANFLGVSPRAVSGALSRAAESRSRSAFRWRLGGGTKHARAGERPDWRGRSRGSSGHPP